MVALFYKHHPMAEMALHTGALARRDEKTSERPIIFALLAGNFIIGTGILLPAGMLTDLAEGLAISVPTAGSLMLASGVVVALGAPLIAAFTSAIDRRVILAFSLLLYVIGHAVSGLVTSFPMLIAARTLIAIGAAIFTPQAAATLGALIPPERRASAITLAFVGWSLATVAGMPMGGWLAHAYGWRSAFWLMTALSAIVLAAVWMTVPKGIRIAPLNASSWRAVAKHPALLLTLAITILNGCGQFTLLTYLNPSLKSSLGADTNTVALILAWFGLWATTGNFAASRCVEKLGPGRVVTGTLAMIVAALTIWGFGAATLPLVLLAAALWGFATFSSNSVQQARLSVMAPELASASVALNTSAMYVGQGSAAALGGALISKGHMPYLPFAGAGIVLVATALSAFVLMRRRG